MTSGRDATVRGGERYESLCEVAGRLVRGASRGARRSERDGREGDIARWIEQAGLRLSPETVIAASRAILICLALVALAAASSLALTAGIKLAIVCGVAMASIALVGREAVLTFPRSLAARRASTILRSSAEGMNIMIMSLRHEPSLPRAIRVGSSVASEFGSELGRCIWEVIMGAHSTFEDSLQSLATRWGAHSREFKSSIQSMITASCEGTEEGRRSALDRASRSLVSGARRRIEDYALSLSLPSMMLFSIGVLLPLMVGSFLPMLSWDIWDVSGGGGATALSEGSESIVIRIVFVMNIVFPALALLIAMEATSRRPLASLEVGRGHARVARTVGASALALSASVIGLASSALLLDVDGKWIGFFVSGVLPTAFLLVALGRRSGEGDEAESLGKGEDDLFRIGARLVEGENFESAVRRSAASGSGGHPGRGTILSMCLSAMDGEDADIDPAGAGRSAAEAARVVVSAASKDEAYAGLLAMDLARYIRELTDLERTLRRRLRPTVSMMRLTAHVLAPVMLGITYAIYLSLASIAEGNLVTPGPFFVVLGTFLVETNAVVAYFVWGMGDTRNWNALMRSIGTCALVAALVYSATAVLAA